MVPGKVTLLVSHTFSVPIKQYFVLIHFLSTVPELVIIKDCFLPV